MKRSPLGLRRLQPIVEGEGDVAAVPTLIRRILEEHNVFDVSIGRPHLRGDIPTVLPRFEEFLQAALIEGAPILWVLDYDCDDCHDPDRHRDLFIKRANGIGASQPIEFVFMVQEFETLFLVDERTTRHVFADIPATASFPADAERVRDAKGRLSELRPKGSAYKPTQHQQRLTAQLDLATLRRRSPSFRNFEAAVRKLVPTAGAPSC